MVRRTAGFVAKRPHKKSRGGCLTCKRKKVKCDEASPKCSYCELRKLECNYPHSPARSPESRSSTSPTSLDDESDFSNASLEVSPWLVPAVTTSTGHLSRVDIEFLRHYKTAVWPTMSFRQDEVVHFLNRDWVPAMSLSKDYLLYAILSISAAHDATFRRSAQSKSLSVLYRQRALGTYSKALSNITSDNYETLLITSTYMMTMVPPPDPPCDDTTMLTWISALLSMMQGLRILASLKWAAGIEKLTVFPIFRRELRTLPPPPMLSLPPDPLFYRNTQPLGDDPAHPNPPQTYETPPPSPRIRPGLDMSNLPFRPQELMAASKSNPQDTPASWKKQYSWQLPAPAFLPPPLMALLKSIVKAPETGPIDLHRPTLVPALHALSPIFLSLYYYHLNPDLYVRIFVLPTFLTPEFFNLVRDREPRALIVIGWWFAFVRLIPNLWWLDGTVPRVLQAVSNEVMRCNDRMLMDAMEGAYRIVRLVERKGQEEAARSCFEGWEGVRWEEGPGRDEEWRFEKEYEESLEKGSEERFQEVVDLSGGLGS